MKSEDRSPNVPNDTKQVPLKMWVKGILQEDADLFDIVTIKTATGRYETGRLKETNPPYRHNYGDFVPEILEIRNIIKQDIQGEGNE